jgi:LysM repeat protein
MRARTSITTTTSIVVLAFLALLSTTTHTVSRGETLAGIARRHGTTVSALAAANQISDPNRIYAGQRLTIGGSAGAPAATTGGTHTVVRGDTLGTIARRAGTTVSALVQLNRLANPNLIRVGQVLRLPAGGTAPAPAPPSGVKAPAGGATTHVVRSGDTLSGIAARYGISQQQLIDANGITGGRVYLGQQLRLVPAPGSTPTAPAPGGTTHVVRSGETLSSIARRYGTTIKALQSANGITDANVVVVGRRLTVPGTGGGSTALRCPVQGGVTFMNDWGFPRSGGRFHTGNDLFAPRGRSAVAVVSGTVTQTTGRLGGNQVKLVGDDGVTYHYTHLDRFGKRGRVAAGDVVGYVGSSGNAAGGPTHVHFELHPAGSGAVNPYPRIVDVCR